MGRGSFVLEFMERGEQLVSLGRQATVLRLQLFVLGPEPLDLGPEFQDFVALAVERSDRRRRLRSRTGALRLCRPWSDNQSAGFVRADLERGDARRLAGMSDRFVGR